MGKPFPTSVGDNVGWRRGRGPHEAGHGGHGARVAPVGGGGSPLGCRSKGGDERVDGGRDGSSSRTGRRHYGGGSGDDGCDATYALGEHHGGSPRVLSYKGDALSGAQEQALGIHQ
jgi:hypothetical protein